MLKNVHSKKAEVKTSDAFVFPNLSKINYDKEEEETLSSEELFFDEFINLEKIIIAEEIQSGKTTLCKLLRSKNMFPLYICDKTHKFNGLISNKMGEAFKEQYENVDFCNIDPTKLAIIIDDFHFASTEKKLKILKTVDKYI